MVLSSLISRGVRARCLFQIRYQAIKKHGKSGDVSSSIMKQEKWSLIKKAGLAQV